MTDFKLRADQTPIAASRDLLDPSRRHLLGGALAAGIGSLLPWQQAAAQAVDKSTSTSRSSNRRFIIRPGSSSSRAR